MNRSIAAYLGSFGVSLLGNGIASVVIPLVVFARTGDVLATGTVAAVTAASAAVTGVLSGPLIDRINRRTVSVCSDLISACAVAALPVIDATWGLSLSWFVVLAVAGAIGDAPGMTAREALLPRVVELADRREGYLDRMVGIRESLAGVLLLVGPGVGGLLVWLAGTSAVTLLATAGTSALAAVLTLLIAREAGHVKREDKTPSGLVLRARSTFVDLANGWRFLVSNQFLLASTLLNAAIAAVVIALQTTILPVHFSAIGLPALTGLAVSGFALGTLVGAGFYTATVGKISRRTWFIVGMIGTLIAVAGIATMGRPWLILVAAFVLGLTNGPMAAVLGVATIEATPEDMRGRILGAQNAVMLTAPALGTVSLAAFAQSWGLLGAGVILWAVTFVTVVLALITPAFRDLDSVGESSPASVPKPIE